MKIEIYTPDPQKPIDIPLVSGSVSAGFPGLVENFQEQTLNLNEYLIKNPAETFYVRAKGHSMIDAGINDGDLLVVDKALEPSSNQIVIAMVNGEFTVKRICKHDGKLYLIPENADYKRIEITDSMDFKVWGVVTHVIHKLQ